MTIISPNTTYTEVSLADEERGLLLRLLREELSVVRRLRAAASIDRREPFDLRVNFIVDIIDKLEDK
jgi:hypothetical protein